MRRDTREERRLEVLKSVVRAFVAHGEPVGSKAVSELPDCGVSAATVRNVMAELEEEGLLSQPHTSAGRVPTERGYRRFVEALLEEQRAAGDPAMARVRESELGLPAELLAHGGLDEFLSGSSRVLSRLCRCIGMVLHPRMAQARLRHAQFLRLDRARVLAVIVDATGVVTDSVVSVEEDYPQDELDRISNYLVNRFQGATLEEVRRTLERELSVSAAELASDAALRRGLGLALHGVRSCAQNDDVYLEGAAACVTTPEFADLERVRDLLQAYEEKHRMARLLRSCLDRPGIQIQLGATETGDDPRCLGMPGLAFVAASYGEPGDPVGTIGVLGPTRMEYEHVIGVVDAVARQMGRMLGQGLNLQEAAHATERRE